MREQYEVITLDYHHPGRLERHAARLLIAELDNFAEEYTVRPEEVQARLENSAAETYAYALVRRQPSGYRQLIGAAEVVYDLSAEPSITQLNALAVRRPERGKEFGRQLLGYVAYQATLHQTELLRLEPLINSRGFYEHLGFTRFHAAI